MTTSGELTVTQTKTDHQKCNMCLYGSEFDIVIRRDGTDYYFLTQCPKCHSYDECKKVSPYIAKQYLAE